jgi:hypothetical protein
LKSGTIGNCASSHCHSMGSPSAAFSYIKGRGYAPADLVSASNSPLSWFGGNMPPGGGSSAAAVKDFNAWYAAGGQNN